MDQALKQRLVGATVLIILGVILLPMLLSGQPDRQNEALRIEVPDKPPELSMETRRFPIGGQSLERPSQVPEPEVERAVDVRPDLAPMTDTDGAEVVESAEVASPGPMTGGEVEQAAEGAVADRTVQSQAPEPGRYLVQVASFSNASNANQLAGVLTDNQLPVLLDNVVTSAGRLHRVRVGPFDQLTAATDSLERIRALMTDLNPRVIDLRPDENAPVTDPSDPMVRWVVQVGSFSDETNAQAMVEQLRQADFTAYSETVTNGAQTVYKVKIGPVIERQSAVELAAELNRKTSIDGIVMSVD
jgi:cell division septation protein DedD